MYLELKKFDELSKIFQLKGITKDSCVLNYCGGGIAASLEAFVLYQLGFENITIYDNSLAGPIGMPTDASRTNNARGN